jgi:hypothetical protein
MNDALKKNIIAILIFIAVALVAGYFAYTFVLKNQQPAFEAPSVNPEVGMGMEGALCGGSKRLPCLPGNQCQITNEETNEGVCVHVTDYPGPAQPPEN